MTRSSRWIAALAIVVAVAAARTAWLVGKERNYVFHGVTTEAPLAAEFELTAQSGTRVHLSDFRGKLVLLYFGYTHCPGVCPTTLAEVDQALKALDPQKASHVQLLMVSVDPERDTPERFRAYLPHFNPTFLGLTGTPKEIATVAARYGIYYRKGAPEPGGGYFVDHTSMVMVVDPAGRVRLLFPFGTTAKDMATDMAHL